MPFGTGPIYDLGHDNEAVCCLMFAFGFVLKVVSFVCVMFLMSKYFLLSQCITSRDNTISKSFTGLVEQMDMVLLINRYSPSLNSLH